MANRISKVYTRTGDDGSTGMADGSRITKDASLIEAIGDVDELNSCIGLLRSESLPEDLGNVLHRVQHQLFNMGGELSAPGYAGVTQASIDWLERLMDEWNANLPPLKEFILPAGSRAIAQCHVCRAGCRRAERRLVRASADNDLRPLLASYLNRLSDMLFVMARQIALSTGVGEVYWQKDLAE